MKNFRILFVFILISGLIYGCSSGKMAYNKGNYYDATLKAVNTLRVKPDSKRALEMVQKSYPMSLNYYRQRITELGASNNNDKYLSIVDNYMKMNEIADEISRCPAALEVLKPVVYFHDQQQKAELLAIDEQYENATKLLSSRDINDARMAFNRFEWVKQKQTDFRDIDRQLAIAKDLGTLKIVVEHLPELHENYDINSRVFYYRLYDKLVKGSGSDFIRFYKPELARELDITPHEILSIQFLEFKIGTVVERELDKTYELDSIVVGSYTDNEGNEYEVKGSVKAEATIFEREVKAKGLLEISIKDFQTEELINTRKFPGEYYWKNEWATFNGDERAVPSSIMALTEEKQRVPPSPQEMYLLFSDPLFSSSSSYLKSYYRKR